MVASGIRLGTPAVTTRGMREARDGDHRRPDRARAGRPRTTIARSAWFAPKWKSCAGSSPCTGVAGLRPALRREAVRRVRAGRRAGPRHARLRAAAGQRDMAAAVARVFEDGGVLLAEAGTGTGKTLAYLVPAILARERVLDLHRHEEPPGTDLLQRHPRAARGARHPVHRDLHEGPRELPLRPPTRSAADGVRAGGRTTCSCRSSANGPGAPRPAIAPSFRICRRTSPFWQDVSATAETCLGTECPRYDDCFVTRMRQRAAASDVVIVNHHLLCADAAVRQNAFGEVIPSCQPRHHRRGAPARGRRDAVLRLQRQHVPRRGSGARHRAAVGDWRDRGPERQGRDREGGRAPARSCARLLHRAGVRAPPFESLRAA